MKKNEQVPEHLVRHITADITEALRVCRDSNEHIYHRDIKPENIMVVRDGDDYERFVLIDFGLAREIDQDMSIKYTLGEQGTRPFIDPAMSFKDEEERTHKFSDMWALGVQAYYLMTGG